MNMSWLLLLLYITGATVTADNNWDFKDTTDGSYQTKVISLEDADDGNALFHLTTSCIVPAGDERHLQIKLYVESTLETIIYKDVVCGATETIVIKYSEPHDVESNMNYVWEVKGQANIDFDIKLDFEKTDLTLEDATGTTKGSVTRDTMLVSTFSVTSGDITTISDWSYIQVAIESKDQFLDPAKNESTDTRLVGRLMVTTDSKNLQKFFSNPNSVFTEALRLSFSTFGMITISDASVPHLQSGTWYIGVILDHDYSKEDSTKEVTITVNIRTDYEYSNEIGILFAVSLLGLIIPLLARSIFNAENMKFSNWKFKYWLITLKNWFWSGKKGLTYLTMLLASLLIVSAFQVVHAKYADMRDSGDRDICFYNEKCYRPYGDHYDVSVNGIASNLPFMVHGVILVLYFSISESYCRSNGHTHFDYSIPYSFGLAFICEGFGSLLYHICPSQIIFQFDTLFMFVISIIMIIAIFEGHSIRDSDLRFSTIATHKAMRTPKVFAFFIGPVYFFNFIGNLIATEGLPTAFIIVFYIVFGAWWIGILLWAAYKLDLWPDSLNPNIPELQTSEVEVDGIEKHKYVKKVIKHGKAIKTVLFLGYCGVVLAGFVLALLEMLPFSIFILGVLIVGQISLTVIFFVPTIWAVLQHFVNLPVQIANNKFNVSKHFLVLFGIMLYVLIGCVVVVISLIFFTVFSVTDKSIYPWRSREQNADCYLGHFYDTHDFWHLFASFALMMMAMVVVQICKPCRECYLNYLRKNRDRIESVRRATMAVTVSTAAAKFKKGRSKPEDEPAPATNGGETAEQEHEVSVGTENPNYTTAVQFTDNSEDPHAVEDV